MYNKRLRSSRSPFLDQMALPLKAKKDLSMRSDSSKHSSGRDVDVPKNTFNIKPLKKIEESKSEVSNSEEEMKKN